MKPFLRISKNCQDGFTLVEIILSLIVSGILAAMIATYISNSVGRTVIPADNLRDTLNIYTVMEHIRLQYSNDTTLMLDDLKTLVGTGTNTGGETELGSITYKVLYNDYVTCDPSQPSPVTCTADSCIPSSDTCMLLVTISDPDQSGIMASNLFTE